MIRPQLTTTVRVGVGVPNRLACEGLVAWLAAQKGIDIALIARSQEVLLELAGDCSPDIVLADLDQALAAAT